MILSVLPMMVSGHDDPVLLPKTRNVVLHRHGFLHVSGPITTGLVDQCLVDLYHPRTQKFIEEQGRLLVYINSPGGSVHAGTHLIQSFRSLQAEGVRIECVAQNYMSMAFALFQACDHRMILGNSIGMQHQMSFLLRGDLENVRRGFVFHDRINDELVRMELDRLGMCRDDYDLLIDHDWWLYGQDAIDAGAADEVVVVGCGADLQDRYRVREERIGILEPYLVETHECPLIRTTRVSEKELRFLYDPDQYPETVHEIVRWVQQAV